jgi:hypothetical protein
MPLISPSSQPKGTSPFDDPQPGETLILLRSGDVASCYAVGDDLDPRSITPAQFIAAAECEPETPAVPLPEKTNERVMAAFERFKEEARRSLGRARRPGADTRVRRYLSKQLSIAKQQVIDDADMLRRIDVLRQIFLDDVPPQVEAALRDIRDLRLEGDYLVHRLEALRERHRLNPPDDEDENGGIEPRVVRIVCSDGLI